MLNLSFQEFLSLLSSAPSSSVELYSAAHIDEMKAGNALDAERAVRMIYRMGTDCTYKGVRLETGLSQAAFAEKYGLSRSAIRRCESVPTNSTNRRMLILIAYAVLMDEMNRTDKDL